MNLTPGTPDSLRTLPTGRRLAYIRAHRGWTQQMLADYLGHSKSWIEKVERGDRPLDRLSVIRDIEDALQAPDILVARQLPAGWWKTVWVHVECGDTTIGGPGAPPRTCDHCHAWSGNWHKQEVAT